MNNKPFWKEYWEQLSEVNFGAFIKTVLSISVPWIAMSHIQKDWVDIAVLIFWGTLIYEFYDKED